MGNRTYLENLRECFHDFGIFIAIHLDEVDECDLRLRRLGEGFDDGCMFLKENNTRETPRMGICSS